MSIVSGPVGTHSGGGNMSDFYVYEWFLKETGEVFYVGKGRGSRYKDFHGQASVAEKIKSLYDTEVRFIRVGLTEDEALNLETAEMLRILNESDDCLTNIITPYSPRRDNGNRKSMKTPSFQLETAPEMWASEIDEHYFHIYGRPFDSVQIEALSHPVIIDKGVSREEINIVYGGDFKKYYNEVTNMLRSCGSTILKSRYCKTVTAWIFPCEVNVSDNNEELKNATEKIGRTVPSFHLIDVWKFLKDRGLLSSTLEEEFVSCSTTGRVPLEQIKNLHDPDTGYNEGKPFWDEGEMQRKEGHIEDAIRLFDQARYNGYSAPALYQSYAKAYRKIKDPIGEIVILEEAISRYEAEGGDLSLLIIDFEDQKKRALKKLKKK